MKIEIKTNKEGLKYFVLYDGKKMVAETDLYFSQEFFDQYRDLFSKSIIFAQNYINILKDYSINRNDLLGILALGFIKDSKISDLPYVLGGYYFHRDTILSALFHQDSEGTWLGDEAKDIYDNINAHRKEFLRVLGVLLHSLQFVNQDGYYNGLSKLKSLNDDYTLCEVKLELDKLYFKYIEKIDNFESYQRSLLLRVKGFQDGIIMKEYITNVFNKSFIDFIVRKGFDAIAVIPNNIQRKVSLNQEINISLRGLFSDMKFIEVGIQDFPERMPQKSTRGLCNRIENAEKLLVVEDISGESYGNILLIDDVFGSGATMNAVAQKIKKQLPDTIVTGFAILSSYRKGFDVLSEI